MLYDAYAAEHIVIVRNAAVNNLDHAHYLIARYYDFSVSRTKHNLDRRRGLYK